ncbi:hypothetical protein UlMin_007762 [Ulmus minor]
MFGRVRASSSSPESLERPPSKIIKDDSLSIYEATLMKLKVGSQRDLNSPSKEGGETDASSFTSSPSTEPMKIEANSSVGTSEEFLIPPYEVMEIDKDCYLPEICPCSRDGHSMSSSKEQDQRAVSIFYLFSKFRSARDSVGSSSSSEDVMRVENSSSVNGSSSVSSCQSLDSMEQKPGHEFVSS